MAMGIVSNDEFEREVKNSGSKKEVIVPEILEVEKAGRKPGDNNVPSSLRNIIGETSVIEGRDEAIKLARMFDISDSSVSAYAHSATSTKSYHTPDKTIADYIRSRKDRVTKKSLRVLQNSLDNLTPEALAQEKPRNIAAIAKDMSAIIKNMEPEEKVIGDDSRNQFIFYSPQFVKEEHYDSIVVNE